MPGKVEKIVRDRFDKHYPDRSTLWIEDSFDAFATLPIELKMVPTFNFLEANLIKGGWAQFLWNGFGSWQQIIKIAHQGYDLIGVDPSVSHALNKLSQFCERNDAECAQELAAEDWGFSRFIESMEKKESDLDTGWEMLLWSGTPAYWKRLTWLDQKEEVILRLLERHMPS